MKKVRYNGTWFVILCLKGPLPRGVVFTAVQRANIQRMQSPLLISEWDLVWSPNKEAVTFYEASSGEETCTVCTNGWAALNYIPFKED